MAERPGNDKAWGPVRPGHLLRLAGLLLVGLVLGALPARAQVAPDGDWRTLRTPHFLVTFPAGEEALARRAGGRAEVVWTALEDLLPTPRDGPVELLLSGDVDLSNGSASVNPARRIRVWLRPPVDGFALSSFDDWLDLVITHELAHVFHLDATGALGRVLRTVFGRVPAGWPFFPGFATPRWLIEGVATWYESAYTGAGRAEGSYFRMMLRTAALQGAFETIDQASGDSPRWPDGERPYVFGGLFFRDLVKEEGEGRLELLVDASADQWIPYRLNAAARDALGESFSERWARWRRGWIASARDTVATWRSRGPLTEPEALTRAGRQVVYPRPAPGGGVSYARADGRSDPQLRRRTPDGGDGFLVRTHGLSRHAWLDDGTLVWAQPEFGDPWRIRSDLWLRDPGGGTRRLTRGERLDHPAPYPDGRWAAAIRYRGVEAELVRVSLADGQVEPLPLAPGEGSWGFPVVSPDGNWLAATRWDGTGADIWILNAATGEPALRVTDDGALDQAPAWSPDGGMLMWGSDRSGIPQVEAATVDPVRGERGPRRAVTRVVTGAAFPAVDASGDWVYISHYTARGWELARVPWEPEALPPSDPPHPRSRRTRVLEPAAPADGPVGPYQALPSLRPRYWEPILLPGQDALSGDLLRPFVGFSTTATDLVDRHAIALQGAVSLSGDQFQGALGYSYRGLGNPVLDLTVQQRWDGDGPFLAQRADSVAPEFLYIREREQRASLGATLIHRRWTWLASLEGRAGLIWESRRLLDADLRPSEFFTLRSPEARLGEAQISLVLSNIRGHALSVSPEEGAGLFVRLRTRREQALADSLAGRPGLDRSTDEILGQFRFFQSFPGPGFGDHVLGLRVAGGAADGPGADGLTFEVGGASGQPEPLTGLGILGSSTFFFPVRGHPDGARAGRLAWSGALEYRFPLVLVNRGLGLFPLHLDRVHGSLFLDAGNAWGPTLGITGFEQPRRSALWSAGAELSARVLALFNVPLHLRVGAALVRGTGDGRVPGTAWYLRFGPSF